jgi:hypothetical protein
MSKKSKTKRASLKDLEIVDEDPIDAIVREQQRRSQLQSQGLPSQSRPDNDTPYVSNGERESRKITEGQKGYYHIPEDMKPTNRNDED